MRIWIITVGEPLPGDPGRDRLWRSGLTARLLAGRGHDVVWWTSTMDHFHKLQRHDESLSRESGDGYRLILLHGCFYGRNIGLARLRNHRQLAAEFKRLAPRQERPDVILCSLPTLELSREAVRFGRGHDVPVVIDIRDQWPDFMLEQVPRPLRPLARPWFGFMYADLREACRDATALISNTPRFIAWGAGHGGRPVGPLDRDFPHGYPAGTVAAADLAAAGADWDARGVPADDGTANICYFGTIRGTMMDFDTVVAAARQLAGRVRFVLCGLGEDRDTLLRRAADLPSLLLPGWVDEPAIQALMRRSVAGLAPYRRIDSFVDNLPNKPLEYLSGGLPVLSCLEGVTRKLLADDDCGYFYTAGDADSLVAAVGRLLDDPEQRARRAEAAARLFAARFSADKVYGELADYLEALAAGRRPVA